MGAIHNSVFYGCETADGGTGFGDECIICSNEIDARAVWLAIQEHPERFDFADIDAGQKRLVRIENDSDSTVYLETTSALLKALQLSITARDDVWVILQQIEKGDDTSARIRRLCSEARMALWKTKDVEDPQNDSGSTNAPAPVPIPPELIDRLIEVSKGVAEFLAHHGLDHRRHVALATVLAEIEAVRQPKIQRDPPIDERDQT